MLTACAATASAHGTTHMHNRMCLEPAALADFRLDAGGLAAVAGGLLAHRLHLPCPPHVGLGELDAVLLARVLQRLAAVRRQAAVLLDGLRSVEGALMSLLWCRSLVLYV